MLGHLPKVLGGASAPHRITTLVDYLEAIVCTIVVVLEELLLVGVADFTEESEKLEVNLSLFSTIVVGFLDQLGEVRF